MKLSAIILLALSVLLAGCEKDSASRIGGQARYATLYFDKAVNRLYMTAERPAFNPYPGNIIESLGGLGVEVDGLDFQIDKENPSAIHVIIKKASFGIDQQAALKRAFSDILHAKKIPAFNGHMIMNPDSPEFKVYSQSQLYERSDNGVYIRPDAAMKVALKYNISDLYDLFVSRGKSEFHCYILSKINHDLPFRLAALGREEASDLPGYRNASAMTWNYSTGAIAVAFENEDIGRLLSDGSLALLLESRSSQGTTGEVSVRLGSLGVQSHNYYQNQQFGKLSHETYTGLEFECEKMAAELGRPFTFHFGDGLDRLKSVEYL